MGSLLIGFGIFLVYFSGVFLFLLSGLFVPFSVLFTDACVMLDDIPMDWNAYIGDIGSRRLLTTETSSNIDRAQAYSQPWFLYDELAVPSGHRRALSEGGPNPVNIMKGCFNDQTLFQSLNMTGKYIHAYIHNYITSYITD